MSMPQTPPARGVTILGTGRAVPEGRLTNQDLEKIMDTSDEWIVQRTGIRERRKCDPSKGESAVSLCTDALTRAIEDSGIDRSEIDLLVIGTVTGEMTCPATACRVGKRVGLGNAGAFDLLAACSGFVYGLNIAHDMIRVGRCRTIAVVGCDVMTEVMDYSNRGVSILFGDAAGAVILQATEDQSQGILASALHANGERWADLYLPRRERDVPDQDDPNELQLGTLQMRGREVYKFAVGTFANLIGETLEKAGIEASDVAQYVCHQSNARMLESARERFGIEQDRMYVNIDRYGNCSAGSVPVCLDELRSVGKCQTGDLVMFVAFGGGLTWASSLWRL